MASSSTSAHSENTNTDASGTSTVTQPGLNPLEGQLLQGLTDLQPQLSAISQRQDELMEFINLVREQQEGTVPGFSSGVRAGTGPLRGSVSYERPGPVPPAGGGGEEPSISRYGRLPSLKQPHIVPPNHSQPPPPLRDPVTFSGPNAPPLQQNPANGGRPDCQQFPPFQGQGQVPGQSPFHRWDQNGQQMNPPPQLPCPFPPPPYPVPTFNQHHGRMGQTVGLTRRNSVTLSMGRDTGPGARQFPPGWPYPMMHRPLMYFPMRPQFYPQTPFQMNPQIPPQMNPQMLPQMQMQGPMPVNYGTPPFPGPPPPYLGPSLAPGEPMSGTNRAGPSADRCQAPGTFSTFAASQPPSPRSDPSDGSETDDTGSDLSDGSETDGTESDVKPVSQRKATSGAPKRKNPSRKARPGKFYE